MANLERNNNKKCLGYFGVVLINCRTIFNAPCGPYTYRVIINVSNNVVGVENHTNLECAAGLTSIADKWRYWW
jgi:hypothetical protein